MGIGTRSKSHQGECLAQEQSLRVTIGDGGANDKGVTSGGENTNNQTNNSTTTSSHYNALLSFNPGGKQNAEDGGGGGTGASSSVTAAASGSMGTNSSSSCANNTSTGNNNPSSSTSLTLVTRTRGVKRPKRDPSPPGSPAKKVAKEVKTATPEAKKRQWELWTVDEKSTFFQALNECGRDFVAIQNNFAQKYKKNGAPAIMIKNKEQVRHFYYRTWHKISKYIEMKDGIKKHALEVYGLIHYGEMRKRLGGMRADKNLHKLNEFIQEGSTLIKIRRKSFRIRTPYCNALKKINNVEDPVEDDDSACRVPERVTLELNPKNNSAWLYVQEMAQNPRLRMTLKSDQHLSTVMSFLQKKWKPPRLKLKESLNSFDEIQKQLVLYPHHSSKCYPVALQAIETQPRPDLKLNNYHANIRAYREKMQSMSRNNENSSDAAMAESANFQDAIKDEASVAGYGAAAKESESSMTTVSTSDFADSGSDNAMFPDDLMSLASNVPDEPLKSSHSSSLLLSSAALLLSSAEATAAESDQSVEMQLPHLLLPPTGNATSTSVSAVSIVNSTVLAAGDDGGGGADEDLEKIKSNLLEQSKKGWTLEEAEDLTVAQLFLIFGKEGLIRLEYDWSKTSDYNADLYDRYTIINRLRRLVHLATMEFTDYVKVKAPKANEKLKSGKANPGCEVCEACGKLLNQSDSNSKGNSKLVNKNVTKTCYPQNNAKNGTVYKDICVNSENTAKCPPLKKETKADKKVDDSGGVDGVFRVPVIPGRGPLSQTLVPNEYINQYNRPRHRRKLQRSARKPVFLQRTLLPKDPRMMTLALLPTTSPVTVDASFLSVNNRTNAVITTRAVSSFSNTYTTQVLTQPIASTLSVHNPNNTIIVQGTVSQQAAVTAIALTTTSALTDPNNTVNSTILIPSPSPSLAVATTNPLLLSPSAIITSSSSSNVSDLTTGTSSDMITLLNVTSSRADTGSLSTAPETVSSPPPNISTLFDISLSDVPMPMLEGSEGSKGPSIDCGLVTPPLHTEYRQITSPYNSPFKFNSDNAWMLGEMADISLGSLLGDSPIKKGSCDSHPITVSSGTGSNSSSSNSSISGSLALNSLFNDWSRDSSTSRMDLDTTLQMIMNENSMDYVSKFAELAEKVAAASSDATAAEAAAAAARISAAENNDDENAQDNMNCCTNTDDCLAQLNEDFH